MKVSLNAIKQFIDFELPAIDELVKRINEQLGGVEAVHDLNNQYKDVVIVKVMHAEKHPDADRLRVTLVDDGGIVPNVPRDENGYVQVVCGAPNAREGIWAAWLPPKAVVPATFTSSEPFTLEARAIRGVVSQGMLAAADELAIGSDHEGIIEINPDEWRPSTEPIQAGSSFAKVFGIDDTLIEIENKMFTHRPDCFGQLGVAREIAGILGHQFKSPDWYTTEPNFPDSDNELKLEIFNDAQASAKRFMAVAIKNVTIAPSPLWLQCELVRLGGKPINNIVDVTNYIMLTTAQPVHAYDYDKIRGSKLGVRFAKDGEEAELLNGKTYRLHKDDIVIADAEGVIGLAGIMGGNNSEVSETTQNLILEVANFDMYAVRKTSMRQGLFTDALTRFNKGQSPLQNHHILARLIQSIIDIAGGEVASPVLDDNTSRASEPVSLTSEFVNERLGLMLSSEEIASLLGNTELAVSVNGNQLTVTPPFWRTDIELPEDVVEEVGRLYGFNNLPLELPARSMVPAQTNGLRVAKQGVRDTLSKAGANEVLTYSFVHEKLLQKAGQDSVHAYKLSNALSPDLQYYRTALMPSLLDKVHMNSKSGHDAFALFEINKVHYKGEMDPDEPTVPNEDNHIALILAYANKQRPVGSAYYYAREYASQIIDTDELDIIRLDDFDATGDEWGAQLVAPYEPARTAVIVRDGAIWGVIGEFKMSVKQAFKLPEFAAGFELHMDLILNTQPRRYKALSRYPSSAQDLSLKVSKDVTYRQLIEQAKDVIAAQSLDIVVTPVSIYQPEGMSDSKTITLRFVVTSYDKTLTDADIKAILESVAKNAKQAFKAEVV